MKRTQFYKRQAESFRDYAGKFPDLNLLSVFNKWADSKDLDGIDRQRIWKIARKIRKPEIKVISDTEEEFIRLQIALEIVFEADLAHVSNHLEKSLSN